MVGCSRVRTQRPAQLAKYAAESNLDLAAYHRVRGELGSLLGSDMPDGLFAQEVLNRLQFNGGNLTRAVGHARIAVLDEFSS